MHGHLFIAIACAIAVLALGCISPAWAMTKRADGSRTDRLNYLTVSAVVLAVGVVACLLADSAYMNMDMSRDYWGDSPSRVDYNRTIAPASDY